MAAHSTQLSDAITQLTRATTELVNLLTPNLGPLEQDVGTITTAGRTIDRNISTIDEVLAQSVLLFSRGRPRLRPDPQLAEPQQPDPARGHRRLRGRARPGPPGRGLPADPRQPLGRPLGQPDRDAGRPAATRPRASSTRSSTSSPTILNDLSSGTPPTGGASPASMLQQGLAQIPGASSAAPAASPPRPRPVIDAGAPTHDDDPDHAPPARVTCRVTRHPWSACSGPRARAARGRGPRARRARATRPSRRAPRAASGGCSPTVGTLAAGTAGGTVRPHRPRPLAAALPAPAPPPSHPAPGLPEPAPGRTKACR